MLHQVTLTIPANTPESALVSATLRLDYGVSTRREVAFPDGCHGRAHVQVYDAGWQIIPWTRGEWLSGDGGVIVDDSVYNVYDKPYEFTLYGWNEDTVNDHTVTLYIQMVGGAVAAGLARFVATLKRTGII